MPGTLMTYQDHTKKLQANSSNEENLIPSVYVRNETNTCAHIDTFRISLFYTWELHIQRLAFIANEWKLKKFFIYFPITNCNLQVRIMKLDCVRNNVRERERKRAMDPFQCSSHWCVVLSGVHHVFSFDQNAIQRVQCSYEAVWRGMGKKNLSDPASIIS